MLIDWFTVGAQVLNFIILIWLMKRFLYKPILNAIDAREKRIAATVADATAKEEQAQKERDEFQQKNAEFEQQLATRLQEVEIEAKNKTQQIAQQAQQTADQLSLHRQAILREDAKQLNQALTQRLQKEVFAIARQVLADLASANLEKHLVAAFIQRLQTLDTEAKNVLLAAINNGNEAALVRSAFELDKGQQTAIQQTVNEIFDTPVTLQFETVAELISGIELSCGGQKVAWSIAEYLSALEGSIEDLLAEKSQAPAPKSSVEQDSVKPPLTNKAKKSLVI